MKKQPLKLNNKRWAMYAAAGAAAAFSGAGTAEADITHVVLDNDAGQGVVGLGGSLVFELGNGSNLSFANSSLYGYNLAGVGVEQAGGGDGGVAGFQDGSYVYGSNVDAGINISSLNFIEQGLNIAYADGLTNDAFDAGDEGFVAFSFNDGAQFGWARLTFDEDADTDTGINTFVVNEYAFTDAVGTQIVVGQTESAAVPEPTSLGLLALGAVGVLANRRRKTA